MLSRRDRRLLIDGACDTSLKPSATNPAGVGRSRNITAAEWRATLTLAIPTLPTSPMSLSITTATSVSSASLRRSIAVASSILSALSNRWKVESSGVFLPHSKARSHSATGPRNKEPTPTSRWHGCATRRRSKCTSSTAMRPSRSVWANRLSLRSYRRLSTQSLPPPGNACVSYQSALPSCFPNSGTIRRPPSATLNWNTLRRCISLRIAVLSGIRAVLPISPSPKLGNAFPTRECNRCSSSTWSTDCCTPDTSSAATVQLSVPVLAATGVILSLVEDRPRHGYDIGQLIELRSRGALRFNVASLYPLLYRLEKRGWIRGRWVEKAGQRRRRYYRLTPTGKRVLAAQRDGWKEFVGAINRITGIQYA